MKSSSVFEQGGRTRFSRRCVLLLAWGRVSQCPDQRKPGRSGAGSAGGGDQWGEGYADRSEEESFAAADDEQRGNLRLSGAAAGRVLR
jgi:hypothetical protein